MVSLLSLELAFQIDPYHLAVPAPPEDLRLRVKAIEEHIIRLEKDYPPWAALHFNQPQPPVSIYFTSHLIPA